MKTEFKGSEGKWGCVFTSDKKRAVRNKGGLICTLYHPSKYSGQDERYDLELEQMRADQRLIANAPELLQNFISAIILLKQTTEFEVLESYKIKVLEFEKILEETLT